MSEFAVRDPCCMNAGLLCSAVAGVNTSQGRQFQGRMGSNAELFPELRSVFSNPAGMDVIRKKPSVSVQ